MTERAQRRTGIENKSVVMLTLTTYVDNDDKVYCNDDSGER